MQFNEIWQDIVSNINQFDFWGIVAFVSGILAVIYLIKESIWTWPLGIIYTLISVVVFYQSRLYGDLLLHIFYLVLNGYGWYYWSKGGAHAEGNIQVTHSTLRSMVVTIGITVLGVIVFAEMLIAIPTVFEGADPPALPYWDSTTSVLSVAGMWLTTRKKIDNWYYWFVVDILASGIYFYKGLYFYSALYLVYIGMAVVGYLAWKKSMKSSVA